MKILLDTHVLLWWITDDSRLSTKARRIISDAGNDLFFSAASGWEIAIKAGLGRISLPEAPDRFIPEQLTRNSVADLPVNLTHALHVFSLPMIHRDPFDRLLVAQAQVEKMKILTSDPEIKKYNAEVIWD